MQINKGTTKMITATLKFMRIVVIGFLLTAAAIAQEGDRDSQLNDQQLREGVKKALIRGSEYLKRTQKTEGDSSLLGSWSAQGGSLLEFRDGFTSLAVMALINSDVPVESFEVQQGLNYLRRRPIGGSEGITGVYETSLIIMALCAAEQYDRDLPRIQLLSTALENAQIKRGQETGLWGYKLTGGTSGDASNGQYAVLALRDAAYAGANVSRSTWERIHDRWTSAQNADGGWGYNSSSTGSKGSMTVAGLSTVAITTRILQDDSNVGADGRPDCCFTPPPNLTMENGRRWMARNFSVTTNPGFNTWHYYYLYGLERAGRMSGVRFFGTHDWYRRGAQVLVAGQLPAGDWLSQDGTERDPVLNTSMALLFLSKGLSRVVVNKLDYNSPNGETLEQGEWNRHPHDVVNLVDLIDGLKDWPPRLLSQVITLSRLKQETAVLELNQSPVLFLSGREAPKFTDEQVGWLRDYIDNGGFIFAAGNCDGQGFDSGFRDLIKRMFPQGDASLQRLRGDHPVYRSEFLLNAEQMELWGVDFGCRTSIIYSPDDIGCLWQKWMKHEPPNRNPGLSQQIIRGTRIGVNVIAYATGREPPEKLDDVIVRRKEAAATVERGLLQIGQLRHNGGWETAPKAVKNLLMALNDTVGVAASTRSDAVPITLEEMSRFPLVYMHGRHRFQLQPAQQDAIRDYLSRGGVLLADACCGSSQFDRSFRDLVKQLYPDTEFVQIPVDHELFSKENGHDIKEVRRRRLVPSARNATLEIKEEIGPPFLEGIEIDGRFAIIYSRYDISCALEHQASLSCDGYVEIDAVKLAINAVLYAMQQEF
ncbi:MAG: DUF4159 domain-containing protein [Planctomycetota bacterium]|nr:DUF4159 domain-containing protein [Planctomycetota bacterium]